MADIGRILSLPAPAVSGRPNAIQPASADARARASDSRDLLAAAGIDATDANGARAKSFRFRVYDGGRADEALAGDNGIPARRTGAAPADAPESGGNRIGADGAGTSRSTGNGNAAGLATPSAAFLAQLIAQEQLRPGLYDPPLRAADRAYRQAGGEPALADGPNTARFQIAI
jgi:hypothetical protein